MPCLKNKTSVMVDIFDIKISCTQGTEVCRHNHDRQKHILGGPN